MKFDRFMCRILAVVCLCGQLLVPESACAQRRRNPLRETDEAFFATAEARRIGDQVLVYQRCTGGWPKNIDMAAPLTEEQLQQVLGDKARRNDSTIDNDATSMQMFYLARLYRAAGDVRYRDAFRSGVEYLLSGQYDNGGWPQFWPEMSGYQVHITFNDDAMVNTLELFSAMIAGEKPFDGDLVDESLRARLKESFDKGIACILRTQIVVDGKPTVWCQQHNRETYAPAGARSYELPSYCSQESAAIVRLLMAQPDPDANIKAAVHGAMKWFDNNKITGYRIDRSSGNATLVADTDAKPIWARFYDLEHCIPFVCDRDGVPQRSLESIGSERRNGYSWYNSRPADLYPLYESWAERFDAQNKLALQLDSPGANERGVFDIE